MGPPDTEVSLVCGAGRPLSFGAMSRSFVSVAALAMITTACRSPEPPAATAPQGGAAPVVGAPAAPAPAAPVALLAPLEASFVQWESQGPSGDAAHQDRLRKLADAVRKKLEGGAPADVLFVCTHNSRRSHMAQLLGLAAARRKGLPVQTFSGGTEVTAFNPRAVAALRRVGFEIGDGAGENPHYTVRIAPSAEPVQAFSKRIIEPPNPTAGFVVVMTCSQADAACPIVQGAVSRVAVPYDDPKIADGTPEETARYDERVAQIGRDLAWVFGEAAKKSPSPSP